MIIPEDCEWINCAHNELVNLIIPKGCKEIYCYANKLTKLNIHKSCLNIYCRDNKLPLLIENLYYSVDSIKIELANNLQK